MSSIFYSSLTEDWYKFGAGTPVTAEPHRRIAEIRHESGRPRTAIEEADPLAGRGGQPDHPNPARVYDALLGGKDNYAADRAVADKLAAAKPALRPNVRANRAYLGRAVRHLAARPASASSSIGTGLPSLDNTHEVAQRVAPRIADRLRGNDPVVLAHARALLVAAGEGATAYLHADIRDPDTILEQAAPTIDFSKPVAVILLGVLYMIPDADLPYASVAAYVDAIVPGSYLAISHPASDIDAEAAAAAARAVRPVAAHYADQQEQGTGHPVLRRPRTAPARRRTAQPVASRSWRRGPGHRDLQLGGPRPQA